MEFGFMKKLFKYIIPAAFFLILLFKPDSAYADEKEATIAKGVYIDTVDIGGMTVKEAQAALKKHIESLRGKSFAVLIGDATLVVTMEELDYKYEPNNYIEQAVKLGKAGNLIQRYKDNKDIEHGKKVYPLTYTYNEDKLMKILEKAAEKYKVKPKNATFTRKNGEFIFTDHELGSRMDVESTFITVKEKLDNWNRLDFIVQAHMVDVLPQYTREDLEKCTTILGEFTTEYKDSSEDRAANLANGARLINNAVLYPGDVFSSLDYLLPFTLENGYYMAGSYNAGRIEQTIGGGACQVTTTLYNAVLRAELEIVERHAHSMTVSYVDLAYDAAIAENSKNFKFKNNLDLPILIEAFSRDRVITFRIWGHETRPENRTVKFENKVLKEIAPPAEDKVTKDPTKPESYKKVTQKAKYGYVAELYKIVYVDGVEVSRELVNKSVYNAEPAHVTIGTKKNSN
jgi:vancomycin resistance protein YoaR